MYVARQASEFAPIIRAAVMDVVAPRYIAVFVLAADFFTVAGAAAAAAAAAAA